MNKLVLIYIKLIVSALIAVMWLSSCDDEVVKVYEDVYEYPFYNETADTVYVYDSRFHDSKDTIKASQAIAQYSILERVAPHGMINLFVSGVSLYRYGETGVSQIMVFRQNTLESHTLKEIAEENIYDALYIYPWKEMATPGFEIRYGGESHWIGAIEPGSLN